MKIFMDKSEIEGQVVQNKKAIFAIMACATIAITILIYFLGWNIPCTLFFYGVMAILPFLLARFAPKAANFNMQLFPTAWSHWLWFLGMLLLNCVAVVIWAAALTILGFKPQHLIYPYFGIITKTKVILFAIATILIGPIAEEIFYRGYLLEQLRKLTNSGIAIVLQSVFFAIAHLFYRGIFISILVFLFGLILGSWRIKFRSLLPLILAHIIFNAVFSFHVLKILYNTASLTSEYNFQLDLDILSKPKCQQIISLREEPAEKAIPDIISFFADPDKDVRMVALSVILNKKYRDSAEPYIKETLSSKNKNVIDGALFVIQICDYPDIEQEVRKVIWTNDDTQIQISALITLQCLKDKEGLKDIAKKHTNEKVRDWAQNMLNQLEKPPDE
jgi:membrane protease YdiL (CAAX protease family)